MQTFIEWLLSEAGPVPIRWVRREGYDWGGKCYIDDIEFEIALFQTWKNDPKNWVIEIAFYQTNEMGIIEKPQPVTLNTMASLFPTIEQGILEYLKAHPDVTTFKIHPEASKSFGSNRQDVLSQRIDRKITQGKLDRKPPNPSFDPGKFNAYQYLFQYSTLKSFGFTMRTEGEYLIISRPQPGAISNVA